MPLLLPVPLPALHAALTRFEGGDSARSLQDISEYLGVSAEVMAAWGDVPDELRERVASLCRVSGVHWERPEHDLFRVALAHYRATGQMVLGRLQAHTRSRDLPVDRCFLAASLMYALVLIDQGRPVRGQRWALPPDCSVSL